MRKVLLLLLVICGATGAPSHAGVVMELVTVDANGAEINRLSFYAEGEEVRMDVVPSNDDPELTTIFRGDDEFVVLDHEKRRYYVVDQATIDGMSAQLDAAMQEMEKQLAQLPPEQRAMAEQMMKGGLGGLMGGAEPPQPRIEQAGTGTWKSSSCKKYVVFEAARKTQEICAAPLSDIEGAAEAMRAFERMTSFFRKMADALPVGEAADFDFGELLSDIDGFPVITTQFRSGRIAEVTTLESARDEALDAAWFRIPEGYTAQDMLE